MSPTVCRHCNAEGPDAPYCARCGAAHARPTPSARLRLHGFAGRSREHVALPFIGSTLLPHAEHRHTLMLRLGIPVAAAALAGLVAAGLIVVAVPIAIVVVPVLYFAAIRRAELYHREPARLLIGAALGGLVGGVLLSAVAGSLVDPAPGGELTLLALIILAVVVPLLQEGVKLIPALALIRDSRVPDAVDGLTIGLCAGLGFAVGEAAVTVVPTVVTHLPLRASSDWFPLVVQAALLVPLMQATCAGILATSLWHRRRGGGSLAACGAGIAVVGHVAFAGLAHLDRAGIGASLALLGGQAIVVTGLLIWLRLLLHATLLAESTRVGWTRIRCPHCSADVTVAAFCPACGTSTARAATNSGAPAAT